MNENKIKKLFEAARKETAPEPPFGFARNVVASIRRAENAASAPALLDQISQLFPRLAWAAVMVIGLCLAAEFYWTQQDAGLTAGVEQVKQEFLFAAN